MAITTMNDLNFGDDIKKFKSSVTYLKRNLKKTNQFYNPLDYPNDLLFLAATAGNTTLVKYFIEEYNADPNVKTKSNKYGRFDYALSNCIYSARSTQYGDNFEEAGIYLMDHGADPSINNNEPILAAYHCDIGLIAGFDKFARPGYVRTIEQGHNPIVDRLLKEPSVVKSVFDNKQEQFYYLFKDISDIFLF